MAGERSPIRVVGRYALYNEIAAGGMATIHLGRLLGPVGFARTVAVKRLHPQFAKDPEFVFMFLDEARLAARVQHPNVVATIDVVATDGELFLIMDYVRGESLSKILRTIRKQERRVPPRVAAAIMCGFLHGLHAAHEAKNERGEPLGLVHRDVSPQNVLVGSDGIARVLDFGIAKAQGRIQVTRDGQIKGKLAYMPPEQLAGKELSRTVDVYASAVVMWETLTAERLFKGETEAETLAKILRDPVPPPSNIVPKLPHAFDTVLLRALSRDPKQRHATARELALELERCAGIASPTEVGEWVEGTVGHVLSAREDQIAEIERNSVGLRVSPSGRPSHGPDHESDPDFSSPSRRALDHGMSQTDTIPMGSGPLSGAYSSRRIAIAPDASRTPSRRAGHVVSPDEPTGSKSGTGLLTGTMLLLPVDRKLPILASVAGVVVLIVLVAVIIGGKFSSDGDARSSSARATPSASTTMTLAEPIPGPPPPEPRNVIPEPEPSAEPVERPVPVHKPPPTAPAGHPPAPKATAQRPTAPAPTPLPKTDCEPNYTIDAQGRKKYKRECM